MKKVIVGILLNISVFALYVVGSGIEIADPLWGSVIASCVASAFVTTGGVFIAAMLMVPVMVIAVALHGPKGETDNDKFILSRTTVITTLLLVWLIPIMGGRWDWYPAFTHLNAITYAFIGGVVGMFTADY